MMVAVGQVEVEAEKVWWWLAAKFRKPVALLTQ
jgi:hypothetical protein